jgi:hypothetical protein
MMRRATLGADQRMLRSRGENEAPIRGRGPIIFREEDDEEA